VYAKNWLAHDGYWFQATEAILGLDTAIDLDTKAWHRFTVAEARRIMKEFNIPIGNLLGARCAMSVSNETPEKVFGVTLVLIGLKMIIGK
jgi:Family of unknown function (DUF6125)